MPRVLQIPPALFYEVFSEDSLQDPINEDLEFDVRPYSTLSELNRAWYRHIRDQGIAHGQGRGYQRAVQSFRTHQQANGILRSLQEHPFTLHQGTVNKEIYDLVHEALGLGADHVGLRAERDGPTLSNRITAPHIVGHLRYDDNGRVHYALVSTPKDSTISQREAVTAALDVMGELERYGRSPLPHTIHHIPPDAFSYLRALLGIRPEHVKDVLFNEGRAQGYAVASPDLIGDFRIDPEGMAYTIWKPGPRPGMIPPRAPDVKNSPSPTKQPSDHWVRDTLDALVGIAEKEEIESTGLDAVQLDGDAESTNSTFGHFIYSQILPSYRERWSRANQEAEYPTQRGKTRTRVEEAQIGHRIHIVSRSLEDIHHSSLHLSLDNRRNALLTAIDTDRILTDLETRLGLKKKDGL